MTTFVNGLQPSIRTNIARFCEEHHRDEMTFARLTQEAQDAGNTFRLQMEQFRTGPARSTRAALARAAAAKTGTVPKVQFLEPPTDTTSDQDDGLLLVDGDASTGNDQDTSVVTDDLPSTPTYDDKEDEQLLTLALNRLR